MIKPAFARAFVIILTIFLIIVSLFTVYAEEFDGGAQDNTVDPSYVETTEYSESNEPSESTEATTESIIPAKFPALTVNAISNFFPKSSAEYNSNTKEITVTYWLHSTKNILSVNWNLIYDTESLKFSPEKNPSHSICSSIGDNSVISFPDKGKISYCATNMKLFDFSTQDKPFVQIVFDVINISPDEPILSKIDLTVENMIVSEVDPKTGISNSEKEINVVSDSIENVNTDSISVRVTKMTTLTESNFIQATESSSQSGSEPVTDQNGSVIGGVTIPTDSTAVTVPSTPPVTQPTAPTVGPDDQKEDPKPQYPGSVPTGGLLYAFISLAIIVISSLILFVMRKKEIMY